MCGTCFICVCVELVLYVCVWNLFYMCVCGTRFICVCVELVLYVCVWNLFYVCVCGTCFSLLGVGRTSSDVFKKHIYKSKSPRDLSNI